MDTRSNALKYYQTNKDKFLSELCDFLKIPSISTLPENAGDIQKAALSLSAKLESIGIEHVRLFPTEKHPVLYGDYLHAGKDQPTALVYGHYDVQPVDPLDLWDHSPFDPIQKDENLYARGASDMKGQIWAVVSAIESIMSQGDFPINLKFLIEGEEEIGSPNLHHFIETHTDLLASDFALNADAGMVAPDVPTIVYGLRGLAYFELKVYGPGHDLHSGVFGGVIQNPAQALAKLISGMVDNDGHITLPGFYDKVLPLSSTEKAELARLNMDDQYYLSQTGSPAVFGEKGYSSVERIGARPTLDVNGLYSGFIGSGAKTIIPAWAMAKISTRLVPNQTADEVHQQLLEYLQKNAPATIRWELTKLSGGSPSISDISTAESLALAKSFEEVWGVKTTYKREGGSVPVVADMQQTLHIDSVLTGFGLPDDNIHSPNEKLHLPTWYKGIDALIRFFYNVKR